MLRVVTQAMGRTMRLPVLFARPLRRVAWAKDPPRVVLVETYGCQMNVNDTEVVLAVLKEAGFRSTHSIQEADIVLLNTCAVRENAEARIWHRLEHLRAWKKKRRKRLIVGVLGCMAGRLKQRLLEEVDLVVGPDSYRDLPRLRVKVVAIEETSPVINVQHSFDETYADIMPVRSESSNLSAYVSIMRGCDNMCSYCIVPFTRGRERSRPAASIEEEVRRLADQGIQEITLLGQNVNSYLDSTTPSTSVAGLSYGFPSPLHPHRDHGLSFPELMDRVSSIAPDTRFRFTSPHPKDFPDELLWLIRERPNVCKAIHLPAQSGSTSVLERMRRRYTREAYLMLVDRIRDIIPGVSLSSDFICGFCGETEQEHRDTLSLMEQVKFDMAFMFAYSLREGTHAHRHYVDDVSHDVKLARLQEVIQMFHQCAEERNKQEEGQRHIVLVEGVSRRSNAYLSGRTDTNKRVHFPNVNVPTRIVGDSPFVRLMPGDYVVVEVDSSTSMSLMGHAIARTTICGEEK